MFLDSWEVRVLYIIELKAIAALPSTITTMSRLTRIIRWLIFIDNHSLCKTFLMVIRSSSKSYGLLIKSVAPILAESMALFTSA